MKRTSLAVKSILASALVALVERCIRKVDVVLAFVLYVLSFCFEFALFLCGHNNCCDMLLTSWRESAFCTRRAFSIRAYPFGRFPQPRNRMRTWNSELLGENVGTHN